VENDTVVNGQVTDDDRKNPALPEEITAEVFLLLKLNAGTLYPPPLKIAGKRFC